MTIYSHNIQNDTIPLVTQNLACGLRESALKSTTAGFANAAVLSQYEGVCDRRFQDTLTQSTSQILSHERYTFWPWKKGRIHYVERGEGPHPVVLLHGFGANTFTWENQIDLLSQEGFHVWAIDFLGFGLSDKPLDIKYSVELYREQIEDFLEAQGIQKIHVVANSMGGTIALALAEHNPEKISSMVLIDPLAYPIKIPFLYSIGKIFGRFAIPFFSRYLVHQTLKKIYYDPKKITEAQIDAYWRPYQMEGGREAAVNILHSFDQNLLQQLRPSYAKMNMPILLVWGEQDKWIPSSHLARLLEDFPHAEQMTIPFCGHAPQEEAPDEVNPRLIQFLHKNRRAAFIPLVIEESVY